MTLRAQEKAPIQKKAPNKNPKIAPSEGLVWRSPNKKGDRPSHASIVRSALGNEADNRRDAMPVRRKTSIFLHNMNFSSLELF